MKKIVFFLFCFVPIALRSIEVELGGFAQLQSFYDTREVIAAFDDLFSVAPAPALYDAFGNDINNQPKFNMCALASQVQCKVTGPSIKNFTSKAYIEFDFVGTATGGIDIGAANLRQAYGLLTSDHHEVLFGLYWHPIRPEICHPHVVGYNDGAPISPYALDPQVRYYYRKDRFELLLAAIEQGHIYVSDGPEGETSRYIRRAMVPNLHVQLGHVSEDHMFGVGIDYKRLVPRLVNNEGNEVHEQVNSVSATIHGFKKFNAFLLRTQAIYAQNLQDMFSTTGYAVTSRNPETGEHEYAPMQSINFWLDVESNHARYVPGIFVGVAKSLGTTKPVTVFGPTGQPIVYDYISNVSYVFRISPRMVWNIEKFRLALECEYTGAAYGNLNNRVQVENGKFVGNLRALLVLTYFF